MGYHDRETTEWKVATVTITRPTYASLRDLQVATDAATTAYNRRQLESALEAGSAEVDALLNREDGFAPLVATRKFDWPPRDDHASHILWLNQHEAISFTSLVSGGTSLTEGTDYLLRPWEGPPYNRVEILLSSSSSFSSGDTWQEAIVATGTWGYTDVTSSVTTLAEALDASETGVDVGAYPDASAGDLLTIDSEKLLVTGASLLDTGQNLGGDLTESMADDSVTVSDGTGYSEGELLTIDSEKMLILDIAGNTLMVTRAADGSTLATHSTGADIYAPRTLTVERGARGTTAATHTISTTVEKQVYPSLVRSLALAEALNIVAQETSSYARTVGSGEAERNASGAGLASMRKQAWASLGRTRGPWAV